MEGELRHPYVDNSRAQDGARAPYFRCTSQPTYSITAVDFAGDL